jgi:dolichyl-phosphate-mannose-protein mannosyltransferase
MSINKKLAILIVFLGLLTRFLFFGLPDNTVFDEVYFGQFITSYFTHEYYFDIHPPLGKLIIAGFAKITGYDPDFKFKEIGQKFPDKQYLLLRFLPTLAGALLPLIIFLLAIELGFSSLAAFFAGLFLILENGLLTQSRLVLMDIFLLLFGFLCLYFYFRTQNKKLSHPSGILLTSVFGALAFSIKWTGLTFIAIPAVIEIYYILRNKYYYRLIKTAVYFAVVPLLIYFSIFTIHFALLYKSGPGDVFMRRGVQKTLIGNQYQNDPSIAPSNMLQKFMDTNSQMFFSNKHLRSTHPYSSKWYTWPLLYRPIHYWTNSESTGVKSSIYLIGNIAVWWLSASAVLIAILKFILDSWKRKKDSTLMLLLGGYLFNLLPFIFITRTMYLYHYLSALIFSVLLICYLIDSQKNKKNIFILLGIITIVIFILFAPLTYGLPMTESQVNLRMWFKSWTGSNPTLTPRI